MEEGGNVVYKIEVAESVVNCDALVMLPGAKSSDTEQLHGMGKVSWERNDHYLVAVRFQDELRCSMGTYVIVKEESPFRAVRACT